MAPPPVANVDGDHPHRWLEEMLLALQRLNGALLHDDGRPRALTAVPPAGRGLTQRLERSVAGASSSMRRVALLIVNLAPANMAAEVSDEPERVGPAEPDAADRPWTHLARSLTLLHQACLRCQASEEILARMTPESGESLLVRELKSVVLALDRLCLLIEARDVMTRLWVDADEAAAAHGDREGGA